MVTGFGEERAPVSFGRLEIDPPQADRRGFTIIVDLAGVLGLEFNHEAAKQLRAALRSRKEQKPKGTLEIDHEADYVFLRAGNTPVLVHLLEALIEIAGEKIGFTQSALATYRPKFEELEHSRPKAQNWKLGDVFAFALEDGSFGFGQVVGVKGRAPATCALLDERSASPVFDPEAIATARVLAILHCGDLDLASGRWRVIGHREAVVDPWSGPANDMTWGVIAQLANAYYGLSPWNEHGEKAYDKILMPGVRRPSNAKIATDEELEERRQALLRRRRGTG